MAERENTWHAVLTDKKAVLSRTSTAALLVTTEGGFRAAYEKLCDQHYKGRAQRYLAHFLRQYQAFVAFTGGIDGAGNLTAPDNLTSLLWASAYAVIEVCIHTAPV